MAQLSAPPRGADSQRLTNDDLTVIRQHTDWRHLFLALGIAKDAKKSREHDWWGTSPFKPDERTASFHLNDRGWYCHATGQGGGPIELVQQLHSGFSCYDAGRWLLEHGVSSIAASTRSEVEQSLAPDADEAAAPAVNRPIRQDLRPLLHTDHPAFATCGVPPEVLETLGAGYLERPPRKDGRPDPINRRLVFQIRGLVEGTNGALEPTILSHIGRATTSEQEAEQGKWWMYRGFRKSLELYHLDRLLLEESARAQAQETGQVVVVEGCFDVAKLVAARLENVVATFGAHLSDDQLPRFDLIAERLKINRFLICYDRDQDGANEHGLGAEQAAGVLLERGFEVEVFDWNRRFHSPTRGAVALPPAIGDPCDFSVAQLQWLRAHSFL